MKTMILLNKNRSKIWIEKFVKKSNDDYLAFLVIGLFFLRVPKIMIQLQIHLLQLRIPRNPGCSYKLGGSLL